MRHTRSILTITLLVAALTACSNGTETTSSAGATPDKLTVIAHDSFAEGVDDSTFAAFTEQTGLQVDVLAAGDAGALVNQAVLTKDNPLADVLFGVDDTFLSRALDQGIFTEYRSAELDSVIESLGGNDPHVTPIDYGDVCFNYDKGWFDTAQIPVPSDLEAFKTDVYAEHTTVEHPATSSPGLAFMLATIDTFGEDGWLDWWSAARDAGISVAADWDTAYYADFTRYGGNSSIVMSYASSPPAEVIYAEEPLTQAPTGVIEAGCYRQVEYAGILAGTEYPEAAGELIDFMLSLEFQEGIPLTWFVFPAKADAALPQEFVDYTVIPDAPARLDPSYIAENRDRWIDEWIGVMEGS